ncbi:tetratricopeptide repeat protein [Sphingomonas sp. NSE70-1]|uniref:Tetratricopeptide repeat protein n=1 Tax=Sphingomonas caseinilyticus TaxID=2908205 RepID=A0ABT0RQW9_9SPHN|nr:SPOR domain-containing protein [Sphingomonas caseinilyticus]MCL6697399.1 tetratricopeptide repeat protein [Sphingomonas caseinilyticus]
MTKNRLGTALTAVSLIAITAGCTTPGQKFGSASGFGGPVNSGELGLATKAQLALAANDIVSAISLAERAVERSPQDAGFRALLGNSYLAGGRFASAEAAYRDSLSIYAAQPQVVLKLALVQIALGKNDEAKLLLAESQGLVDPSDAGLALALAGDPQAAIAVLEPVARAVGADARTRQNLALAHAFAGNWEQAKIVAAQDVPGDQLDARIQQWMALSTPARASDQVAALIGIQPAAADPGQPVRLALNKNEAVREAAAQPVVQPYVEPSAPVELSSSATVELPPAVEAPVAAPPVVLASAPAPEAVPQAEIQTASLHEARPALSPAAARLSDPLPIRKASAPRVATGKSKAVVQLGAYSSRERVAAAWAKVSGKHGSLKNYVPVTARFTGAHGTVYRLSVKGFDNSKEANGLCASLKRNGRECFVRAASGDAPVQFASR